MNGKLQVHGHCNGLKTTLLFALMWGVIMLIWWATGAMSVIAVALVLLFWRKRYLARTSTR